MREAVGAAMTPFSADPKMRIEVCVVALVSSMLNFTVTVAEHDAHPNYEVDSWRWLSVEEAKANIKPGSLARDFLIGYFTGEYPF